MNERCVVKSICGVMCSEGV